MARNKKDTDQMVTALLAIGFSYAQADRLLALGARLDRFNEKSCNYELSARSEKMIENSEKEVNEIAATIGSAVIHNGDPRGPAFRIFSKEKIAEIVKPGENQHAKLDSMSHIGIAIF